MRECQGRRIIYAGLIFVLAGSSRADSPPSAAKNNVTVEKRESIRGDTLAVSPRDRSKPAVAPAVTVRILDKCESGWNVVETNHFRVYHVDQPKQACKAAEAAEEARASAYHKWFTDDCPEWERRGEVFIFATARDYSAATGTPPQSPGHSEIRAEAGRIVMRRIHVHADVTGMVSAVLPHEVTHTVLAGQFGNKQVPRWADEGMAVLDEPSERIDSHLQALGRMREAGQLFTTRELLGLKDYPEPRRLRAFYAQSVSLTEFLTKAKSPRDFVQFVRDGEVDGYETALKHTYGWDFDELEQRWRKHAFSGDSNPAGRLEKPAQKTNQMK
jgi:hypothetical protein